MLAATISRSGDAAGVQHLISLATAGSGPAWQRAAVLQGLDTGLFTTGGRGAVGRAPSSAVALSAEPKALTQLAAARTDMGRLAMRIASRVDWPGKPAPVVSVPPLTPDEQRRFTEGAELYRNICIGCHQLDGHGRGNLAPTLVDLRAEGAHCGSR